MNNNDVIISLLGNSGKKAWLRSDILDILSGELRIEKTEANSRFTTALSRTNYFDKISDVPVKYEFSKTGGGKIRGHPKRERRRSDIKDRY